jgi:hypothetical protein
MKLIEQLKASLSERHTYSPDVLHHFLEQMEAKLKKATTKEEKATYQELIRKIKKQLNLGESILFEDLSDKEIEELKMIQDALGRPEQDTAIGDTNIVMNMNQFIARRNELFKKASNTQLNPLGYPYRKQTDPTLIEHNDDYTPKYANAWNKLNTQSRTDLLTQLDRKFIDKKHDRLERTNWVNMSPNDIALHTAKKSWGELPEDIQEQIMSQRSLDDMATKTIARTKLAFRNRE